MYCPSVYFHYIYILQCLICSHSLFLSKITYKRLYLLKISGKVILYNQYANLLSLYNFLIILNKKDG